MGTYPGLVTSDPAWQRPEDAGARPATARLVDPEEDLGGGYAASGYGGDFETTRIPPYATPPSPADPEPGPPSTAYGLIGDPEPLPYSAPPAGVAPGAAAPVEIAPSDAEVKAAGRRGTQDLGLLLLRVALGLIFIAHGLQKAFGWFGGSGPDAFRATLTEAGYQNAGVLTYVGAGVQIAAGVLLVLGLFTPLAAAAALAFGVNSLLVTFDAQRQEGGLAIFGSETEYLLLLALVAAAVILAGPGRYGFDGSRGWARRPFIGSALALILGVAGGVAAWFLLHGINPFA